jgi:lipopolysaccharide transport system permease protein
MMKPGHHFRIEPDKGAARYWQELWHYRELLYFLAWRDILVRYKQTAIGIAWSLIRPVLTMAVLAIVFGKLAKLPSGDVPYLLFVFAAMLPWQFFSTVVSEGSNSLIDNANVLSKVYFPRILVPSSVLAVSLVEFAISFAILFLLMIWFRFFPDVRILLLPLLFLLVVITSLGFCLWLSALNVKYRDFRYVIPFLVQFGLYLSPVGFSSSIVPGNWRLLYSLNPMVCVIDAFRWSLFGSRYPLYLPGFAVSLVVSLIVFGAGLRYFKKTERYLADIL